MGSIEEHNFSAPPEIVSADGLLFDFDGEPNPFSSILASLHSDTGNTGTIIDSTAAIVKHWEKQGDLMGVDPNVILATSHGRRSIDVFKLYDPSKANWECKSSIFITFQCTAVNYVNQTSVMRKA